MDMFEGHEPLVVFSGWRAQDPSEVEITCSNPKCSFEHWQGELQYGYDESFAEDCWDEFHREEFPNDELI